MTSERFHLRAAVYLLLIKDGKMLLQRRFNTGWMDGMYSLPAGHLDGKETVTEALIREAREETGIEVVQGDCKIVHTMHRNSKQREYIDFFVVAEKWKNEPTITEPDKCDDLSWFSLKELPKNLLKYVRHVIECYQNGVTFSEFGWNGDAE